MFKKENLIRLRKRSGLTQKQLAELTNVSTNYIARLEGGHNSNPSSDLINRLCVALDAHPFELSDSDHDSCWRINLKTFREQKGLSFEDLSTTTSIPSNTIADIENGVYYPSSHELDRLALALGTTPFRLAEPTSSPFPKELDPVHSLDAQIGMLHTVYTHKHEAFFLQLRELLINLNLLKYLTSYFFKRASVELKDELFEHVAQEYFKSKK